VKFTAEGGRGSGKPNTELHREQITQAALQVVVSGGSFDAGRHIESAWPNVREAICL
jgi:hypothetical protein